MCYLTCSRHCSNSSDLIQETVTFCNAAFQRTNFSMLHFQSYRLQIQTKLLRTDHSLVYKVLEVKICVCISLCFFNTTLIIATHLTSIFNESYFTSSSEECQKPFTRQLLTAVPCSLPRSLEQSCLAATLCLYHLRLLSVTIKLKDWVTLLLSVTDTNA
jgi:hypothetical protein